MYLICQINVFYYLLLMLNTLVILQPSGSDLTLISNATTSLTFSPADQNLYLNSCSIEDIIRADASYSHPQSFAHYSVYESDPLDTAMVSSADTTLLNMTTPPIQSTLSAQVNGSGVRIFAEVMTKLLNFLRKLGSYAISLSYTMTVKLKIQGKKKG